MLALQNKGVTSTVGYNGDIYKMFETELGHTLNKKQTDNMLKAVKDPETFIKHRDKEINNALIRTTVAYKEKVRDLEDYLPASEVHKIALEMATSVYNDYMNTVNILNPAFNTVVTDNLANYNAKALTYQANQAVGNNDKEFFKQLNEKDIKKYLKKDAK